MKCRRLEDGDHLHKVCGSGTYELPFKSHEQCIEIHEKINLPEAMCTMPVSSSPSNRVLEEKRMEGVVAVSLREPSSRAKSEEDLPLPSLSKVAP